MRNWKPEDIFDVQCPFCGLEIEFWKDEPVRLCRGCGNELRNPRINLGCAQWCKSAKECLGQIPEEHIAAAPIIDALRAQLMLKFGAQSETLRRAEAIHALADTLIAVAGGDPCVIKAGALLAVVDDPMLREAMIERIGIDAPRSQLLQACLEALMAGTEVDAVEFRALADAVAVERFAACPEASRQQVGQLLDALCLDASKIIVRRRFGAAEE